VCCGAGVLGDLYSWNPSSRAWTDIHQAGGTIESCHAESLNDLSCTLDSPCALLCDAGSIGRRVLAEESYENKEAMAWVIGLETADRVTLHFTHFDTEGDYDFVSVYNCSDETCTDRKLIDSFSGQSTPADVTSSTGFMWVEWTSDYSVTYTGWTAKWTVSFNQAGRRLVRDVAGHVTGSQNNGIWASMQGEVPGLRVAASLNDFSCTLESPCYLEDTAGSVGRLEQFPTQYQASEAMAWIIGLPDASHVVLHFTNFDTEKSFDIVSVYSCTDRACLNPVQLRRFSGQNTPADATFRKGYIRIEWTSDDNINGHGWRAEFAVQLRAAESQIDEPPRPQGRYYHGFAACRGKLYTFGGVGAAGKIPSLLYFVCMQTDAKLERGAEELLSDFWSWDPSSATWTMLSRTSNAPSARAQHGLVSVNDMLYLYGGRSASGWHSTSSVLIIG
jgi:hypothetical protein